MHAFTAFADKMLLSCKIIDLTFKGDNKNCFDFETKKEGLNK